MPETKITDEQIATEVMGFRHYNSIGDKHFYWENDGADPKQVPNFLTDHNAAMLVVEKMKSRGFAYEVDEAPCSRDYHVEFYGVEDHVLTENQATDKSLCVAICEAALKAVRS